MASARTSSSLYDVMFTEMADRRTSGWFLMDSPVPGLSIMVTYLLYVTVWGPRHMRNRKPLDLNSVLIVYNFLQVLLSLWLVYESLDAVVLREDFSFRCQPVLPDGTKEGMREARIAYVYFLAKITELLDTVFFVLRKKDRQISFLHIYHHTIMPILSWGFAKYCPGGHVVIIVVLNSFVHVIMYSYYMLAACGPGLQKYLWWKKYITVLQMVQFVLVAIHNMQLLFTECDYPKASLVICIFNSFLFMYMFNNFYRKAYGGKKTGERISGDFKPHGN